MTNYNLPTEIDLSRTILWQYANADRLISIIKSLQESAELSTVGLWKLLNEMFDISTPVSATDNLRYREIGFRLISTLFGCDIPLLPSGITDVERLDAIRRYIQGFLYLIDSDGSVPELNAWLRIILPNTLVVVKEGWAEEDPLSMTLRYIRPENISELEASLLSYLPMPAGVVLSEEIEKLKDKELTLAMDEAGTNPDGEVDTLNNAHFKTEN